MFQTGFPSIIRSSKLHIQRQVFVRTILVAAASLAGMLKRCVLLAVHKEYLQEIYGLKYGIL